MDQQQQQHTPVEVGQVYADRDPRAAGRTLQVIDIVPGNATIEAYAVLTVLTNARNVGKTNIGSHRRVKLRRMRYAYRLVIGTERAQLLGELAQEINKAVASSGAQHNSA